MAQFHDGGYSDPPPAYSSNEPATRGTTNAAARTFDAIEDRMKASKHFHELSLSRDAVSIRVGHPSRDTSVLYEGYIRDGDLNVHLLEGRRTLATAQARWRPGGPGDFQIYVGPSQTLEDHQWTDVRYEHKGSTHADCYLFTTSDSRKLIWRGLRGHGLRFVTSKHDWQLEDGADIGKRPSIHKSPWATMLPNRGEVLITIAEGIKIAQYHAGRESGHGTVQWDDEHGEETEVAALVVLLVILVKASTSRS